MTKDLKEKAIDIRGKEYVLVSDRIIYFNETYPQGFIETKLLSEPDSEMVVIKAKVTPDIGTSNRYFIGHSQAKWGEGMVNKTAALENAETSAVGRALAMMGIGVIDSIASVDEMKKATQQTPNTYQNTTSYQDKPASEKQKQMIFAVAKEKGIEAEEAKEKIKTFFKLESFSNLTMQQAKKAIDNLLKMPLPVQKEEDFDIPDFPADGDTEHL